MTNHRILRAAILMASVSWMACSSSSSTPATIGGVDGAKKLADLTSDDKAKICDAVVGANGGYGYSKTSTCDAGLTVTVTNPKNQGDCVSTFPKISATCTATVQNLSDCMNAMKAADPCATTTATPPACAAVNAAGCMSVTPDDGGTG